MAKITKGQHQLSVGVDAPRVRWWFHDFFASICKDRSRSNRPWLLLFRFLLRVNTKSSINFVYTSFMEVTNGLINFIFGIAAAFFMPFNVKAIGLCRNLHVWQWRRPSFKYSTPADGKYQNPEANHKIFEIEQHLKDNLNQQVRLFRRTRERKRSPRWNKRHRGN